MTPPRLHYLPWGLTPRDPSRPLLDCFDCFTRTCHGHQALLKQSGSRNNANRKQRSVARAAVEPDADAAATKIQAHVRGREVRKKTTPG